MLGLALAADAVIARNIPLFVIHQHEMYIAAFLPGCHCLILQTPEVRKVPSVIAAIKVNESASVFQEFVADFEYARNVGRR